MVQKSENRSYELSRNHYAYKWKAQTYNVGETNLLAIKTFETVGLDREDAVMALVQRFHSLLYKFMKLLITGKPDLKSKHQREFLCLFMSKATPKDNSNFRMTANQCTIIFRPDTPDDIYNQLVLLFLQLLDAYNPTYNVGFVYFINYFFKYQLKKYIVQRYYDAMDYQYIDSEDIASYLTSEGTSDGNDHESSKLAAEYDDMFYDPEIEDTPDTIVDLLSTKNIGPLRGLDRLETYIVYLIMNKEYRRADIMKLYGFSNSKMSTLMNRIKKKVGIHFDDK